MLDRAAHEESEVPSVVDEAADELHPFGAIRGRERIEEGRGLLPVRRAEEIIDTVKFRRPLTKLAEKDAVVVQLGRDAIGKHKVSSDTFARAQKLFGNQGLVNIVALMGDYAATTMLLNVADQHVRPKDTALLPLP